MLMDVVKAVFYTCGSYPKIAAPHRYSISNDYDLCILSSISSAIEIYSKVLRIVDEFKRGERGLGGIEIGRNIARALSTTLQNIGYNMSIEMCIASVYLIYIDVFQEEAEADFRKALRRVFNATLSTDALDSIEFIKVLKNIGGGYHNLLDKADISERRISLEGLSLGHVMDVLSKHHPVFECFSNVQKVLDIVNQGDKVYTETRDINKTLSRLFIEIAKKSIDIPRESLTELLKVDTIYRKKGIDLGHIVPCLVYPALYIIKQK
ncbi:MAG: hypothetical protein QW101_05995 [Ignisphaera sp.]|uniref:Uncharacterized protein n=2 Tax=Ignisphaera aggregans TaxID=334771 RepID=A0A832A946_9CREN